MRRAGVARRGAIALLLCALSAAALAASAPGSPIADATVLDRYLQGLTSLRTGFQQTVHDAHGASGGVRCR